MDFENFQVQIGQSPLLSAYAGFVSYMVIILELVIVLLLIFPRSNLLGLYASTALMSAFTVYIFLILTYSDFVPCSCGGILEKMGWTEHLIFNIACVIHGLLSVGIKEKENRTSGLKTVILLSTSNLAAFLLVIILFYRSEYIIKKENNFIRRFLMIPLLESKTMALDNNTYYFAGSENNQIYLGNKSFPQNLLIVDSLLSEATNHKVNLELDAYPFRNIELKVQGLHYYIYDGNVPVILKGKLDDSNPKVISYQDAYFSQMEVIDSTRMAICTQSSKTKNLTLGCITINSGSKNNVQLFPELLEKQTDGVFDSYGHLSYDPKSSLVTYMYAYRNQFLVMSPFMKLNDRMTTIDTTKTAQIQVTPLSNGSFKMSKPPLKVNGNAIVYRGLLFNPAHLRGKHETLKRWKQAKVIDIYNAESQNYIGSMYIDNIGDSSMSGLRITDQHLYAIIGKQLVQYRLTNSLTKHFKHGEAENRHPE